MLICLLSAGSVPASVIVPLSPAWKSIWCGDPDVALLSRFAATIAARRLPAVGVTLLPLSAVVVTVNVVAIARVHGSNARMKMATAVAVRGLNRIVVPELCGCGCARFDNAP